MKRVLIAALLIGAIVGLSAFPGHHGGSAPCNPCENFKGHFPHENMERFHREHFMGAMIEELDLSDEQQSKFEKDKMEFEKFIIEKDAEIKILHLEQRESRKNQDFAKMKKTTNKVFELKKQIALERIKMHEKHWNQLTDEQQEKVKEFMKDHPRMGKKMRQKAKHMKK
ncbi:MAG: hypothetical protein K8S23_01045 [Candidatus Cloacimonetes bacterium]|nr:hypothetical protein [Candidatus Cloacimonadota bacterium]